jgi:hypothetical protein
MRTLLLIIALAVATTTAATEPQEDPQTLWQRGGASNRWSTARRDGPLKELESQVKPGLSADALRTLLGAPQSEWKCGDGTIWTYGVRWGEFFQVLIDEHGRVTGSERRNYSSEMPESRLATNEQDFSSFDVGCWRATVMPRAGRADRLDIGRRAFRYITAKMSCDEVERVFGAPFFVEQQGGHLLWVYRMGPSEFVLIVFSSEKEVVGVQERIYDENSGQVAKKELISPSELVDDKTADVAAWRATWKDYTVIDDRRGIGKKMETYIKAGMTKEEVQKLVGGKPDDIGSYPYAPLIWGYNLHADSSMGIKFDANGNVFGVQHYGM